MPMPRPRYNQNSSKNRKDEGFAGLSFLQRIILLGVTFAAVWGLVQIGTPLLSKFIEHTATNMQMGLAKNAFKPDPSWVLESSVEKKAGFFCDDTDSPCPSIINQYSSTTPVTTEQLKNMNIASTITGTCEPTGGGETVRLCEASGSAGLQKYESYVLDADSSGKYRIVVSIHSATTKK